MRTPSIPAPVIPEEKPVVPMPDPEDVLQKRRSQRRVASRRRSGAASTIMSDVNGPQTLGG